MRSSDRLTCAAALRRFQRSYLQRGRAPSALPDGRAILRPGRTISGIALALPLLLSGCNILPTTRHLPVPKAPPLVQTATPEELVKQLNQRWDALDTLTATVEIYATELKSREGLETDFPSCRGFILMRKPKMLRVVGTYFGAKIFDMTSNGSQFTLVMPTKNRVIEGSDTVTEKSSNPLENLRPDFFLNSLVVRGLDPDNEYMVTNDTETVEDAAKKHLYTMPEYVLNVMQPKGGKEIQAVRVITFHRDDMLPSEQDIYDSQGNLETQISYGNYTGFSAGKYPSKVTIKRPQEGIQLVLSVERVEENVALPDGQFQVTIPEGTKIQQLK
jgi:outer membrane lipoprotein-sorting protein